MRRKSGLLLGILVVSGMAMGASGDGFHSFDATAREAWSRIRAVGGDLNALADPIAASGVLVTNTANTPVVALLPLPDLTGAIAWGNKSGVAVATGIKGLAGVSPADAGFIVVRNSSNTTSFLLDGNSGLQSVAGDLAEAFPARGQSAIDAGSVLVIDPERAGSLRLSGDPYDKRVAGVASGARDYRPGITLRGLSTIDNPVAVTLTGTVYCKVAASNGPVRAGDLLTTSPVPGHAMRATDREASRGAILGKAMEDLRGERGLILVLASLQ